MIQGPALNNEESVGPEAEYRVGRSTHRSCVHPEHKLGISCYNSAMRIGIDARMSGPNVGGGGLGRYVEQLTRELPRVDKNNRYLLFQPDIPWYTLKEQFALAPLIDKKKLDLVHFPHWNVPLFLKTPFVVTIHDLILLEEPKSARATTRHPLIYALKYAGFKRVLAHAADASQKIIAVSQATKSDILRHFPHIPPEKIVVIYEGITALRATVLPEGTTATVELSSTTVRWPEGGTVARTPYLLYVGNCYPHKNLSMLLRAFDLLHPSFPDLHLVFAGRDDAFSRALEEESKLISSHALCSFIRNPSDADLASLYASARVYVFPSRIEGFGLPPLEAMTMQVPVACSDIPSLREILGESAVYFSPNDPKHMAETIAEVLRDEHLRTTLIQKGNEQTKKYSWTRMAQETASVYQSCERP